VPSSNPAATCRFVTFYSFKGGVGRTLALVNTALTLAQQGRRILLIDFDLEAPGLDTFAELKVPRRQKGVVDLVTEYIQTGKTPDVRHFVHEAHQLNRTLGKGGLWIMPAGDRSNPERYHNRLAKIDWLDFYEQHQGYLLFEDVKAGLLKEFRPDYVFIDSRTGYTDVGGICTTHLPHLVVLLFYPNEQNLRGVERMAAVIRSSGSEARRAPQLLFVASNVPDLDDEQGYLEAILKEFEKRCEVPRPDLIIHHHPSLSLLKQELYALCRPKSGLTEKYRELGNLICSRNPLDRESLLRLDPQDREGLLSALTPRADAGEVDLLELHMRAREAANYLQAYYGDDEAALKALAEFYLEREADVDAEHCFGKLAALAPARVAYRLGLASALRRQKRQDEAKALLLECRPGPDTSLEEVDGLAKMLAELGAADQALTLIHAQRTGKPENESLRELEADLRSRFNLDPGRAAKIYQDLLELGKAQDEAVTVRRLRARLKCLLMSGDQEAAVSCAQAMAKEYPHYMVSLEDRFNIAYTLRDSHPVIAQSLFRQIIEEHQADRDLHFSDPSRHQTVAFACRFLNRDDEAIGYLERAIRLAKDEEQGSRFVTFPLFRNVPRDEFIELASQQLSELKKNQRKSAPSRPAAAKP
jgi:MinD-like ATPase involved in chromosome partitioning or flagellar assembly